MLTTLSLRRLLLLFFFSVVSSSVQAVDYYWQWSSNTSTAICKTCTYSTPSQACSAATTAVVAYYSSGYVLLDSVVGPVTAVSTTYTFTCNIRLAYPSSPTISRISSYPIYRRYGDSCPTGTTLNPTTQVCEEDAPPECKVGELFPSKGTTGPIFTSSSGIRYVDSSPRTMCQARCEYADPTARPSGCYSTTATEGYCNFIIKSTGKNCSSDSYEISVAGSPLNPPDTPSVPDSSPDPVCPTGWSVSNGTCFKNPPKFCDPSTGEVCAPGTTDPNATDPEPGTGGTPGTPVEGTEGRPDSSSGADKDLQDLLDSKVDAEPCKPFADGTGCEGSTVKGEQCDKVIECTGDAVQCSILRQQKKMACAYEYEEARPFIEQQIAKDAYDLPTETVDGSALFTAGLNAPRWLPQGCPAPKAINITGISTSLSFEPACDFARTLGPLFVALASIFFAVYVGRAFGGN